MQTVIGVLLIIMGIFLIISVLMQSSKDHRQSGTIAGGAETFFGKQKGKTLDAMFNKLTTIVTIVFVVLVLVLYVMQPSLEELQQKLPDGQQTEQNGDDVNPDDDANVNDDTNVNDDADANNDTDANVDDNADVNDNDADVDGNADDADTNADADANDGNTDDADVTPAE